MDLSGIITYTLRAVLFALPLAAAITALRLLLRKQRGQAIDKRRELLCGLFLFYILALVQITAIRDGAHLLDWWTLPHGWQTVQLLPLVTTLQESHNGLWAIIYPIVGNMVWFLPLGLLLAVLRPASRLGKVALVSLLLSLGIEVLQWLLLSGVSDVDDVLFNLAGGCIG